MLARPNPLPHIQPIAGAGQSGGDLDQRFCSFISEHPHPLRKAKGCQFEGAPLYRAGERTFCIFHLPLDTAITPQALSSEGFGFSGTKRKWNTEENEDFARYLKTLTTDMRTGERDFTGVVFPSDSFFRESTLANALFGECTFHKRSGTFTFIGTQFSGEQTWFQYARFLSPAQFTDAKFLSGSLWFTRARFAGDVTFAGCQFPPRGAHFPEAAFEGTASFQRASFQRPPQFTNTTFAQAADFSGCEFPGGAYFHGAKFLGNVSFAGGGETAIDPRQAAAGQAGPAFYEFTDTAFDGEADFSGRHFGAPAHFGAAQFAKAPVFHGAVLPEGSVFPPIDHFKSRGAPEDEARYATLKRKAAAIAAGADQEKFWILEMMSRRRSEARSGEPVQRVIHAFYESFGLYGSSIARPALWLAALVLLAFPAIFAALSWLLRDTPPARSLLEGIRLSVAQTVRPFSAWFDPALFPPGAAEFPGASVVLALTGSVQSLLVLVLLVLLLIALRRRFRLS